MQDSLLIVHASDNWLNSYLTSDFAFKLKTNIQDRINEYLGDGKRIFYTPYISNEKILPSYFPENKLITNIQISENGTSIPSLYKIKFEVISILDFLQNNNINSIEIGGVQYFACVSGTYKAFNSIEKGDVKEYIKYNPNNDRYNLICATKRRVCVCTNKEITDYK